MHVTRMPSPVAPSWTPVGLPADAVPTRAGIHWPAWLEGLFARLAERREISALEERDLRDIGLTQAEAWALARQSLWRR